MMRPLRHKAWDRQLRLRWQTDILQQLPKATIVEMKRCAAAILSFEAAQGLSGAHPLIRSYNRHAVGVRRAPCMHAYKRKEIKSGVTPTHPTSRRPHTLLSVPHSSPRSEPADFHAGGESEEGVTTAGEPREQHLAAGGRAPAARAPRHRCLRYRRRCAELPPELCDDADGLGAAAAAPRALAPPRQRRGTPHQPSAPDPPTSTRPPGPMQVLQTGRKRGRHHCRGGDHVIA